MKGFAVLSTFVVIVCIATFGIFTLRFIFSQSARFKEFAGVAAGIVNSLVIIILNKVRINLFYLQILIFISFTKKLLFILQDGVSGK